jgi:hypothetical protein
VLLVAVAIGYVVWEPLHGPVILSISSSHGVDTGDLVVVPVVLLAAGFARVWARSWVQARHTQPNQGAGQRMGAISTLMLGVTLMVASAMHVGHDDPLVPAGGATIDGDVAAIGGQMAIPVRTWSHVAVTYDGDTMRLYVNGLRVSSSSVSGQLQRSGLPVWIGGNHPYGEHFRGLIDEVRVYRRSLSQPQISADMAAPIAARPAASGLVAAYPFETGSGSTAVDESGHGNDGVIREAIWSTEGRYGNALRFDGADSIVRVPPSASLDLTSAMTLSAWVRPSSVQLGWRTIVQRETDAYFLDASSDLADRLGPLDTPAAGLVIAAAAWCCLVALVGSAGRSEPEWASWWIAAGLFGIGSFVDALLAPSGTLIGPALVAGWFAVAAGDRRGRVAGLLLAVLFVTATLVSLAGAASFALLMGREDGGVARSVAIGLLLVVVGTVGALHPPHPVGGQDAR